MAKRRIRELILWATRLRRSVHEVLRANNDDPGSAYGGPPEHGVVDLIAVRLVSDQQPVWGVVNAEALADRLSRNVDANLLPSGYHPELDR